MEEQLTELKYFGEFMLQHGQYIVRAMLILIVGLIAAGIVRRLLKKALGTVISKAATLATVLNVIYILLVFIVVAVSLQYTGLRGIVIYRTLGVITLGLVGIMVIARPYLPTLPFKVGNTVEAGGILGKVEATTFLNTRLKTFDGKTIYIPNRSILNDIVVNYHYTPNRRVYLDVDIRYDQDLIKAKRVLETVMIEDPRVLTTPRPVVYTTDLKSSCVELSGRCWVTNPEYWKTRCELLEKTKLRFDHEGIVIAYPQLDVHHYGEKSQMAHWIEPDQILPKAETEA
jgi:small conductance mechanosensitive channel